MPLRSQALRREISEEGQSRQPDPLKVFHMAGPRNLIGPGSLNANVLVVTWQGFCKAASKPEGAKQKNSLAVADVTYYLPDGPFFRRVAVQRLFRRNAREKGQCFRQLNV